MPERNEGAPRPLYRRVAGYLGRIRVRLFVVNLIVMLVPIAGLEFARLYERSLLDALERDMRNQAVLVRRALELQLAAGHPLGAPQHAEWLTRAARDTRMRVRVVDANGAVVADSHAHGPPEGPEPPPPSILPAPVARGRRALTQQARSYLEPRSTWVDVADRPEIRDALEGKRSAWTRVSDRVHLFVSEPLRHGNTRGAVYVTRSTQPVLVGLYKIRTGLYTLLGIAVLITLLMTLALAWSISRPLARLATAARRISAGERDVPVPVGGGGEIRELGEAFGDMTRRLDERIRYIADFSADVAHELKSPLTSIRGAAELLTEGADDDPDARARFLRNIELDVERLDRLVSRLLELSRIEASSQPLELVDLAAVVRRAAKRAESPDNAVTIDWDTSTHWVRGREAELETALLNLLDNAVRFSPTGEEVRVTVRSEADSLVLTVRDRGPGIPDALVSRVFDRFFTTDAERNGTGLGLSITKAVALAHDGTIRVENLDGGGAQFTLRIPARADRRP